MQDTDINCVSVVRKKAHVEMLHHMGEQFVLNSSDKTFMEDVKRLC
jgi:hypothetical protein